MELNAPSKCGLLKNLVIHDLREALYKVGIKLGVKKRRYIDQWQWEVPKSQNVEKILSLGEQLYSPALFNHGMRSYSFGKIMMSLADERVDEEVFFIGSLLHDLGLMRNCTDTSFEFVGAQEACGHCHHIFSSSQLEVLHEMILLHDAVGHAEDKTLELKYLHYGAGIDVADLWSHRLHEQNYKDVYALYPSHNHISEMIKLMELRMKENPKMYLSTLINLGFYEKMKAQRSYKELV